MLDSRYLLNTLKAKGYTFFAGVACSYLTELINLIEEDKEITYVAASNEGDAVALAAGVHLAGGKSVVFMQNSGLGNAVNPISSLLDIFEIPILLIITHRGDPKHTDEPQHRLMGEVMPNLLDNLKVKHISLDRTIDNLDESLLQAINIVETQKQSCALIIKKGCFDKKKPRELLAFKANEPIYERAAILSFIQQHFNEATSIILATTGYTGRELYSLADKANQFYMVGSMGCVSSIALGIALKQPHKKVIVIDGDGAVLMRMGAMVMLGHYRPKNLLHIVLDNGAYESTGGQTTISSSVNFSGVAKNCGYEIVLDSGHYQTEIKKWCTGLGFIHIRTKLHTGTVNYPRPTITPPEVADRIRNLLSKNFELSYEIT